MQRINLEKKNQNYNYKIKFNRSCVIITNVGYSILFTQQAYIYIYIAQIIMKKDCSRYVCI